MSSFSEYILEGRSNDSIEDVEALIANIDPITRPHCKNCTAEAQCYDCRIFTDIFIEDLDDIDNDIEDLLLRFNEQQSLDDYEKQSQAENNTSDEKLTDDDRKSNDGDKEQPAVDDYKWLKDNEALLVQVDVATFLTAKRQESDVTPIKRTDCNACTLDNRCFCCRVYAELVEGEEQVRLHEEYGIKHGETCESLATYSRAQSTKFLFGDKPNSNDREFRIPTTCADDEKNKISSTSDRIARMSIDKDQGASTSSVSDSRGKNSIGRKGNPHTVTSKDLETLTEADCDQVACSSFQVRDQASGISTISDPRINRNLTKASRDQGASTSSASNPRSPKIFKQLKPLTLTSSFFNPDVDLDQGAGTSSARDSRAATSISSDWRPPALRPMTKAERDQRASTNSASYPIDYICRQWRPHTLTNVFKYIIETDRDQGASTSFASDPKAGASVVEEWRSRSEIDSGLRPVTRADRDQGASTSSASNKVHSRIPKKRKLHRGGSGSSLGTILEYDDQNVYADTSDNQIDGGAVTEKIQSETQINNKNDQ